MGSSSFVPCVFDMVKVRANGLGVPILFPVDATGFASVFAIHLSIKFSLIESTIWVECEIYNPGMSLLFVTFRENSKLADN